MTDITAMLSQLRQAYLNELPERIERMSSLVLALKNGYDDTDYQELYRHVHSTKGSAGTHGLPMITAVCHQLEDELSAVGQDLSQVSDVHVNHWLAYLDLMTDACSLYASGESDMSAIELRLYAQRNVTNATRYSCLLADTRTSTLSLVNNILDTHAINATIMEDGYQVLGRLLVDKFDMLICGMQITSLNGVGLIAAVKSTNCMNSNIPTVLITSSDIRKHGRPTDPDYIIKRDPSLPGRIDEVCSQISIRLRSEAV